MIPSVAYQQTNWLTMRAQSAYLAGLVLDDSQEYVENDVLLDKIFMSVDIAGVKLLSNEGEREITAPGVTDMDYADSQSIELKEYSALQNILDAWRTVAGGGSDFIQVVDRNASAKRGDNHIHSVFLSRVDLRTNLRRYALNILGLSLLISVITAFFVFVSLNNLIIKPVSRMRKNMAAFQTDPESSENILLPSDRIDEIGQAERGLSQLEQRLQSLLNERRRLAALGSGISKISHDLRNILASAQLMSDRLVASDDPRVKKLSPRLVDALDRAITLSRETLNYGRMSPEILNRETINLRELIENVFDDSASMFVTMNNDVPENLNVKIDRTQFYRGLTNIIRNAVDALKPEDEDFSEPENYEACVDCNSVVSVSARQEGDMTIIDISDNGPGLPASAKQFLYEPFKGSHKAGGSGLGIAITSEILSAHGGEFNLVKSDETGATFRMAIPTNPAPPKSSNGIAV